ncbi:hypothetical protein [Rhodopirellula bahusiensis]|uniref:Uncharacterized protein n=1 Tax=Rhodopirellula bahusiensis TaxID=2014065 RepID=A0A2G1WC00_9BACT|nr:hypothetical protein [Rhodopirellula bahusiensis]PHQ36564.1 hypothetical protein CEE69_04100 [Rhodopirellula bahusiensis]
MNDPNFGYAISHEDLAAIVSERFFEVYNGHPGVNHLGDDDYPGVERIWDLVNAIRQTELNVPPMMGMASDDSHEYHCKPGSRPGRGWVVVLSQYLTPEHLIRAMKKGDFYASSGVMLDDVTLEESTRTPSIKINDEDGAKYRTNFIATLLHEESNAEDLSRIGKVVGSVEGPQASYTMTENELYVRAVITSTSDHHAPSFDNQKQQPGHSRLGSGTN